MSINSLMSGIETRAEGTAHNATNTRDADPASHGKIDSFAGEASNHGGSVGREGEDGNTAERNSSKTGISCLLVERADGGTDGGNENVQSPNRSVESMAEQVLSPEDKMVKWMKETISMNLPNFEQKSMWTTDLIEACRGFLTKENEDKLFVWVEDVKGTPTKIFSNVMNKEPSRVTGSQEEYICYFVKYSEKIVELDEDNVDDHIAYGVISLADYLGSLVYEMNMNTIPKFLRDKEWPENIKKDLLEQTHKFMANLVEIESHKKGQTKLYIPKDNFEEDLSPNDQKDRNHRLKEVLSHWTKQIRDLINNQTNQSDSDSTGPLEEINNWFMRRNNLINIKEQLDQPDLKKVLEILERADPKNLKNFNDLVKNITGGADEAENNLFYLQSLKVPCEELSKASPRDITKIVPNILNCVRLIKEESKFYTTEDKISGLLRKISNEIINRCKKCINLDDMLVGDVHKCIADLKEAINCGSSWKSVYSSTVEAIRKCGGSWQIKADSIFAQIEAFVQRCNDLIEICEGQIQFARKGRPTDLPKFSGSKGPEIVSVLEEIKSSFGKYIERIQGSDKDKLLDINSTKWHDDYSAFKTGTKNLEIMYLNLINSSFENVNKLSQAVEYIEAFDDLAQKSTIKSHVHKQIARVNEIFKTELQVADQASKKPFFLPYNQGKASGEAIWVRSLLSRIEKLKKIYDSLIFIADEPKRPIQEEFKRVEGNLNQYMRDIFIRFKKEYTEDHEENPPGLDNTKVLAGLDEHPVAKIYNANDSKIKPVMVEARAQGKGHIEANINKDLLRILIEVVSFKKLLKENIGNFGPKLEEYVATKREMLRCVREAVLVAVREYNLVHDLMDAEEKQLFEQHLKKLSDHKDKGKKSVQWNPVVDMFVKKMKSQCADIYYSLMHFKHTKSVIEEKISEISRYTKFIVFDPKEPSEIVNFCNKQNSNQNQISSKITNTFTEIKSMLANTFEDFADKTPQIHLAWFEFVRSVDKRIENELRKAVKTSFQEFYKAINGDEKNKTNPIHIFKIFIVLRNTKDDYELTFDPEGNELSDSVNKSLANSVNVLLKFKHVETDLLEIRSRRVAELREKQEEERKKGLKNEDAVEYNEDNKFLIDARKNPPSFKEVVTGDVNEIISTITTSLSEQTKLMNEHIAPWRREHFKKVWSQAKKEYFKQFLKDMQASAYQQQIEDLEKIQSQIKSEQPASDNICIYIDTTRIKQSISVLCHDALKNLLNEIKSFAISNLDKINKEFNEVKTELKEEPGDLFRLKEAMDKLEQFNMKRPKIETEIPLLENIFKLLDANLESLDASESKRRQELSTDAETFKKNLVEMGQRNARKYGDLNKAFNEKLTKLRDEVRENKEVFDKTAPFSVEEGGVEGAFKKLESFQENTEMFRKRVQDMNFGLELFNIKYVPLPQLEQVEQEIENLKLIWNKKKEWNETWNKLKLVKFKEISTEEVKEECERYLADVTKFQKHIKEWSVTKDLVVEIKKVIENLPIIDLLREPYIKGRHWAETKKLVLSGQEMFDQEGDYFTLEKFVEFGFTAFSDKINETAENAQSQYKVEIMILKIESDWGALNIDLVPMLNSQDIYIIKRDSLNNINNKLEEDMVKLATLKNNMSAIEFEKEINKWDSDLNKVLENLETVYMVQRKFEYVDNIFNNIKDEKAQLTGDNNNFETIKGDFRIYMERIRNNPNAKESLAVESFKEKFEKLGFALDKIQNALKDLLRQRRSKFARFYFLSDEDMFELLGNAKNAVVINKHLKKMYEGIKSLTIEEKLVDRKNKQSKFLQMVSPDGEVISLNSPVDITENLIKLMEDIEKQMKETLKTKLIEANKFLPGLPTPKNKGTEVENFIKETPGQIILLCIQIEWTTKCQEIIRVIQGELSKGDKGQEKDREALKQRKDPMKENWAEFKKKYVEYLEEIPNLMLKFDQLVMKLKINAMIIFFVHNRDIINNTLYGVCRTETNFDWVKQLRFDMVTDKETNEQNLQVSQGNARFFYGWEYQGNNGRLIVTPLTDRCYLTLTTAMNLKRGGCPQGPAGTGKTETVKDLGKNMGRFVFVFNCMEGLDIKSMKNMFEGFARTGSWSCFDEFNRIEIEVLSVVAIYIKNILDALSMITKGEYGELILDDDKIPINVNCSIFITMNPGYAGRTPLPDNLKALFRPISMMTPDAELICNISLKSEGFQKSDDLAKKIKTLYDLMSQMLSKQGHYEFGLRSIKSVLTLTGKIKKKESQKYLKQGKGKAEVIPEAQIIEEETNILIKAIRDMNDPKLVAEDIPLFMALLKDLFPGYKIESKKDKVLSMEIHKVAIELGLDNTDYSVNKVIQLFDSKLTRHGNMLVGRTYSGKSTTHKVLAQAMNNLNAKLPQEYNKVQTFTLNPKSISMLELYGYFDSSEDKAHIGVFSYLMETLCNKSDSPDQKWIIFDGPIDTKWVESMNSLLDDNKLLTLLDGNRISLNPLVSLIFETEDLEQASPATVSRCGMIYIDSDRLSWDSLKLRWLLEKERLGLDEEKLDTMEDLFDKWVEPVFEAKRKGLIKDVITLEENHQVYMLLKMLDSFCVKENGINFEAIQTDEMFWIKFERWFTYCVIWSIGCCVHEEYRKNFDTLIRGIEDMFPLSQTVYDCYINVEKNEYLKWEDRLGVAPVSYKPKDGTPKHKLLVDTVETIRSRYLVDYDLRNHLPMLMIGVTGTGKSSIMNSFLSELAESEYSYNIVNLSAQTSSAKLQQIVESKLNTSTKRKFRPHNGKKGVIFIDDLNMPKLDEYGSQPPLELVRQFIEYRGWYDRANLDLFVEIENTDMLCAMAPPAGGRNPISNRLSSRFHVVNMTLPGPLQIKRIYTSILYNSTAGFDSEEVRSHIEKVVDVILDCFTVVTSDEQFKPTPAKSHYLFNLRDMSRIVQAMGMVDKDTCDSQLVLLKLLVHEHLRVYRDRMVNKADKDHFRKIMDVQLGIHFQTNCGIVLREGQEDIDLSDELVFVDFVDAGKTYSEAKIKDALKIVIEKQTEFNGRSKNPIDVVFFTDALKNLCRIHRILRMSNGHALLIGEGGSGRHSLSRMASHLAEYSDYQIKITKNYSQKNFQADMQVLFESIIFKNTSYTFIFSDNEITTEGIIEDVNNILNLGEIPNLYQKRDGKDDFQRIRDKLRDPLKRETDEKIYDNFISRIQQSLHISFCMSQSGSSLRTLARKYPGLINNTTQIWFTDWPQDALKQVATHYLNGFIEVELPPPEPLAEGEEEEEEEEEDNGSEDEAVKAERKRVKKEEQENALREELKKEKLEAMSVYFANVHTSVKEYSDLMKEELRRQYFVTPKSFIDFVKEFMVFSKKRRQDISSQLTTYSIGLNKLDEASTLAKKISEEIYKKNEEQKSAKRRLDEVLKKLANEEKVVRKEADKLREKNEDIDEKTKNAEKLEYECQERLAKVQPILDEANEKVKELENNTAAFAEVKQLAGKKIPWVMVVLKPIMILMGESPTEDNIIKNLANNFVKRLVKTDRNQLVSDRQKFDKFEELTKSIPTDLSGKNVATESLRKYVSAVGSYIKALKAVMPTLEEIENLKKMLANLNKEREDLEYKLNLAKQKEAKMIEERENYLANLKEVEEVLAVLEQRNERAGDLVKGLGNSKESWTKNRENLIVEEKKVEGNVMLSVAFLNYFGSFPAEYREKLKEVMKNEVLRSKVAYSSDWDFVGYVGDPVEILDWSFKGLPSDQYSQENGVIVKSTVRWPLMIDPQNQANIWIKNLLADRVSVKTDQRDPNLVKKLKTAIKEGIPVLLENIGNQVDPSIEPVLNCQTKSSDNREYFVYGEEDIPYNRDFKLYMTTRISIPTYTAEVSTKVTQINFTVKEKGLEEQLLEELIKIMNFKLEETRVESIKTKSDCEKQLKEQEKLILRLLQESQTDMIDDVHLIETLKSSREIEERMVISISTSKQNLEKNRIARDNYRPLGYIGSILYFTIYSLNMIDHMYQFSLESFVDLFKKVVSEKKEDKSFGGASEVIKEKIEAIDEGLRKEVYDYTCRGIFEKDKLLLSLQMCVNLAEYDEKNKKEKGEDEEKTKKGKRGKKRKEEEVKEGEEEKEGEQKEVDYFKTHFRSEYNFFLKGGVVMNRDNQIPNPDPSWISPQMWDNITEMEVLPNFQGISGSFTHTNKDWKRFYTSEQPEIEPLPSDWSTRIKDFSLLVLLRAIRQDRIQFATTAFVKKTLGEKFVNPPAFNIEEIYKSTTKNTPCLFIISPGADPLSYLENLAKEKGVSIVQVSLGQKQTEKAKERIRTGRLNGHWVFLANVHLSVDFLNDLEVIIEEIRNNGLKVDGKEAKQSDKETLLKPSFRLFMTAVPLDIFPISILQKCMKITTEPPKGVKANMLKLYNNLVKDVFDKDDCQEVKKYSQLLFGLTWFHSLVIERKKFRTLGWNVMYDFNDSDFMFSDKLIRKMIDIKMPKDSTQTVQWDAVKTIIAEVNYGGRVTDSWDTRLIKKYAEEIFVEEIFSSDKPFILSNYKPDTEYRLPKEILDESSLKPLTSDNTGLRETSMKVTCKDYIQTTFPHAEIPGVFGSHGNAEVTSQKMEAAILLDSLLNLQPRDAKIMGKSREEMIIYQVEERMRNLPEEINYLEARAKYPPTEEEPIRNVLLQEISRYNKLLVVVRETLLELLAGVRGQTLISEVMEVVLQNISDNKVPDRFKFAYLSIKPLNSWMEDLTARVEMFRTWVAKGPPLVFWLGGFTFPTGFTTALKQKSARASQGKVAIDALRWEFSAIKSEIQQHPREGAYISDIYLEGARWATDDFLDDEISMSLYSRLPVIYMKPTEKVNRGKKVAYYESPVYYYPIRDGTREDPSFLFEMTLPMNPELNESFFIKRGTACLLNLGD